MAQLDYNNLPTEYLEAFDKWYRPLIPILRKLHVDFEKKSRSPIDFNMFCTQMFRETKEGRIAVEYLL